jgi:hypothetical protein
MFSALRLEDLKLSDAAAMESEHQARKDIAAANESPSTKKMED